MELDSLSVRVRFANDYSDIETTATDVDSLKRKIYALHPETGDRVLRIIYLGKILRDDDSVAGKTVHCSVGGLLTDDQRPEPERITAPRGFDRLREAGLSDAEIEELRQNFNQGESDINAEEAWIDNNEENDTLYLDVLIGCCLGFFFGFASLFWVFGQTPRVFTEKKTIAIFAGLLFNILYGLCR